MSNKKVRIDRAFQYTNRKERAEFIGLVFEEYLYSSVLDVGASGAELRKYVKGEYTALDVEESVGIDVKIDLEGNRLPFDDQAFDTVVCTEVLEHLDKIHCAFDELCRVCRNAIVISLPNTRNIESLFRVVRGKQLKFYGLPPDPPIDRHKWFIGYKEAHSFIRIRAERNGFAVLQTFPQLLMRGWRSRIACGVSRIILPHAIFHEYFSVSCWALLERKQG